MATTYFECSIRYEKTMDNGMNKKVTEKYIVDALSYTESEARIIEEMTPFISGGFMVSDIKRAKYSEIFHSCEEAADKWFKCKLAFITQDEKTCAEKKTNTLVLVNAADLRDAVKKLDEAMKGTMADYEIVSVSETPIMDVYLYVEQKCEENRASVSQMTVATLFALCKDGEQTEIEIKGKPVIIDKTGSKTIVKPKPTQDEV